ncbi:MAG TPA: DUF6464 family protein [Coleofasciculaceae cyanobacterium]|jgi:hypothetical protein
MELNSLPAEVILSHPRSTLGHLYLDWNPEPGAYLEVEGQTYMVLERRHRYLLRSGRYQLHKIALYVQKFDAPADVTLLDGRWVIGDITCSYNARSELLRCAINPSGPCDRCVHYQPLQKTYLKLPNTRTFYTR